ncbi:GNAT family N-acetyltransferase [Pseudoalteromonas sp. MMG013]|uniref:GNAT family N-acetyltransferase n=1 Tax=Pseudoalteromonas sp. MMG013 TaxID=2822687 RepID=UPI001B36BCFD|nr:GNAT family N-acetyltransferase [Pseudoalteromonas sp. MMG013]MBQ4860868.1 GNAT family N-acetyltransferase [Pseudoalteromonas sp. MMG013]
MTDFSVRYFEDNDSSNWDLFIVNSHKGTFQHTRKFLSYHGERFLDRSVIVEDGGKIIAVMPAAQSPSDDKVVVSHVGATYGGVITSTSVYGEELIDILDKVCRFYNQQGFVELEYKVTPSIYHDTTDEDELYTLFRLNAQLRRCDISAVVYPDSRLKVSSQRKRSFKKAIKAGLTLDNNFESITEFHAVLSDNLAQKHDAKPVHTVAELLDLKSRFEKNLELVVARNEEGVVISGVLFFHINNVLHAQYIASSAEGYDKGGLDFIFESQIAELETLGKTSLAFGTSNEESGKVLNQNLYRFKRQFGSGSIAHQFYLIKL